MRFRTFKAMGLAAISSLLLAAGLAAYGRFVEPRWIEEKHVTLISEHWKGNPLRLVLISDLHARPGDGPYLDRIVRQTLDIRPDIILLLGDYINQSGDSMTIDTLFRHLAPLMQVPSFAVLGNHDLARGGKALHHMLENLGANVMEGRIHELNIGGDTLYISGIRCIYYYSKHAYAQEAPAGKTSILLSHSPAGADRAPEGTTVTFCGHTHGGQICLPGGVPIARQDLKLQWWERQGWIKRKDKPVYITRGLGTSELPFRLFCRPELVVVELRGKRVQG